MNLTNYLKQALATLILVSVVVGCKRDNSQAYYAPKEDTQPPLAQEAAPNNSQTPPQDMGVPPALPALNWTLPSGWQEKPATGMRIASFTATGTNGETADVSVIPLPISGHELDLVNMWRQQVQLPPTTQADADKASKPVTIAGDKGKLFQFASEQPVNGNSRAGILVAELTRGTMSWFFKMTGDESFVTAQKPAFIEFLKSVQFSEQPETLPAGHPAIGSTESSAPQTAQSATENSSLPTWMVPSDWQSVPPSEFLLAEYSIAGANGAKAEVNVAELNGGGGGLLANVNRWRRQLGLAPVDGVGLQQMVTSFDTAGGRAQFVDMMRMDEKTAAQTRLIGVVLQRNGQSWFYKLMGDETVVAQQKGAFLKFVQSANYANAH